MSGEQPNATSVDFQSQYLPKNDGTHHPQGEYIIDTQKGKDEYCTSLATELDVIKSAIETGNPDMKRANGLLGKLHDPQVSRDFLSHLINGGRGNKYINVLDIASLQKEARLYMANGVTDDGRLSIADIVFTQVDKQAFDTLLQDLNTKLRAQIMDGFSGHHISNIPFHLHSEDPDYAQMVVRLELIAKLCGVVPIADRKELADIAEMARTHAEPVVTKVNLNDLVSPPTPLSDGDQRATS